MTHRAVGGSAWSRWQPRCRCRRRANPPPPRQLRPLRPAGTRTNISPWPSYPPHRPTRPPPPPPPSETPAPPPAPPPPPVGEPMHHLRERAGVAGAPLAELRAQGWPAARLARLAQDFDISMDAAWLAAQTAQRILTGAGAWAWDATVVDHASNEALLRDQGQSLRLDRLVHCRHPAERAGWWVLDYKSAAAPERQPALLAQL